MIAKRLKIIIAVLVLATTLCGCGLELIEEDTKAVTYKELRYETKYEDFYKYIAKGETTRNNMKLSVKDNTYDNKKWNDIWDKELFKELTKPNLENLILDYKLLVDNYENQTIAKEFTSDFYNYLSTNTSVKAQEMNSLTDEDKVAKRASDLLLHSFTNKENNVFTAFINYAKQGTFTFDDIEVPFSSIFYKGEGRGIKFDEALENPMLIRKLTKESLAKFLLDMLIISDTYEDKDAIDVFLKKVKVILFTESEKKQAEVDNLVYDKKVMQDRVQEITGINLTEKDKEKEVKAVCRDKFNAYLLTGETEVHNFNKNDYAGYSYSQLQEHPNYLSKYGAESLSNYFTDIKLMCKDACGVHTELINDLWQDFTTNLILNQYITIETLEKTVEKMTIEKEAERNKMSLK